MSRTDEELNSYDDCHYSSKKARLDDCDRYIRANERIRLHFHGLDVREFEPTFTHQLFDDEKLDFLSEDELALRISVHVQCQQELATSVSITGIESRITTQILIDHLKKGLPRDVTIDSTDLVKTISLPVGQHVHSFMNNNHQYHICLATDKDTNAGDLLHRAEKLAMWFIETADAIDFSDPRWEVLFLYEQHPIIQSTDNASNHQCQYLFVGYTTLFTFHNPILGDRIRVCQALILPPRQARGLGREMLLAVYNLAKQRPQVIEVTVEDPCPGFQALRDAVDLEWQQRQHTSESACNSLKLIPSQAQLLSDFKEYVGLMQGVLGSASPGVDGDLQPLRHLLSAEELYPALYEAASLHAEYPAFRLRVKRALLREEAHREVRSLDKADMRAALSELFAERLGRWQRLVRVAYRLGLLRIPAGGSGGEWRGEGGGGGECHNRAS
jgi:hypothetical protein